MKRGKRGRGGKHSRLDIKLLEYLAELSAKQGINRNEFFKKIVTAWKNGKAQCRRLNIEFRMKKEGTAVFLITKGYKVIAQLPIPEYLLEESNPLGQFDYVAKRVRNMLSSREKIPKNTRVSIKDLKVGMKKICLGAQVIRISKPKLVAPIN